MPDPWLEALLHGAPAVSTVKPPRESQIPVGSKLAAMVEKELQLLTEQVLATRPQQNAALTPISVRRQKIENEIREACNQEEIFNKLRTAFNTIAESRKHLDGTSYAMMIGELAKATTRLDDIDWNTLKQEPLMSAMHLSEETMESLEKLAKGTFDEQLYSNSQALWTLLTILNPESAGYWYRLGIVAHKNDDYELALRAYSAANILNPDLFGAHLFSAECYLELGKPQDAEAEFKEVKRIAEENPDDVGMQELAKDLNVLLQV